MVQPHMFIILCNHVETRCNTAVTAL